MRRELSLRLEGFVGKMTFEFLAEHATQILAIKQLNAQNVLL